MLGEKLGDVTGRVSVRRVLPSRGVVPLLRFPWSRTGHFWEYKHEPLSHTRRR